MRYAAEPLLERGYIQTVSVCASTDQLEAVRFGIDRRATDELDRFEANSASNRERMPIFEPINPSWCVALFCLKLFFF